MLQIIGQQRDMCAAAAERHACMPFQRVDRMSDGNTQSHAVPQRRAGSSTALLPLRKRATREAAACEPDAKRRRTSPRMFAPAARVFARPLDAALVSTDPVDDKLDSMRRIVRGRCSSRMACAGPAQARGSGMFRTVEWSCPAVVGRLRKIDRAHLANQRSAARNASARA